MIMASGRNGTFHGRGVEDTGAESGLKRRQHGKVDFFGNS